jgi:hypothetical protein
VQAINGGRAAPAEKFRHQLGNIQEAISNFEKNAQPKLLLSDLFINL